MNETDSHDEQKTQDHSHSVEIVPLWTVAEAAKFLQRSERWLFYALKTPVHAPGSIPHIKLGRSPRFVPEDMRAWAAAGFPPAADFQQWKAASAKQKRI